MTPLLAALLLATVPATEVIAAHETTKPPTFAVYVQPLGIAGGAALGLAHEFAYHVEREARAVYIPVGFSWAAAPDWGIAGSLAVTYLLGDIFDHRGWNVSMSFGPTWRPSRRREVSGFFVHPKFTVQVGKPLMIAIVMDRTGSGAPVDLGPTVSETFLAGVDVGYETVFFGRLYVAAQLGASVGYGFNIPGAMASPFAAWDSDTRLLSQSYSWGVNVDFLRVGYPF